MNRSFFFLLFSATIFYTCFDLKAESGYHPWRSVQISNEQGLSNSAVNSIYRDSRGFMWFGTWDGLNRFDGKNIKTFYPDPFDIHSISNNIIRQVLEDGHGTLWFVTERGIDRYSHDQENFQSWFTENPELTIRERSLLAHICPEGNIWVGAHGLGLFRFNEQEQTFSRVEISPALDTKALEDFYFHNGQLLLLFHEKVLTFTLPGYSFHHEIALPPLPLQETSPGTINHFMQYKNSLYLLRGIPRGGFQIVNLHTMQHNLINAADPSMKITSIQPSANNLSVWLGTDDGNIWKYHHETMSAEAITHRIPGLTQKKVKIWSILETHDDLLWIGTDGEGVFRIITRPKPFHQIQRGEPSLRQLNHQIVRAIFEDNKGNLWVGTRGNGLNLIPVGSGPTRHFTTANGLTNNAVLSLREDQNNLLWIGHDGNGIDLLDTKTDRFYHFPRDLKGGEHLDFGSVYAINIDAFGQVWLGTSGYGVIGLDVSRKNNHFELENFIHLSSQGMQDPLRSNIVYAIAEQEPNILWLATRGAGIYRFNTLSGELKNFGLAENSSPQLINNDILSLHMGTDGFLWVGSSGGLTRVNLNFTPYSFESFTTRDGLPNNTIHAILEDNQGNIWVSTNKGLSKFDRSQQMFLNFNSADGLQSNEYTDGAAFIGLASERFYFGGINGLDWFYPHEIIISNRTPDLILTSFRLSNQVIIPGDTTGILQQNINDSKRIILRHDQNFFSIGFTTLNFLNPDKTLFQYKLEGFNHQWVMAGNQREAIFTNVPFGKYRLLVKATNEDGIWSDETKELLIIIRPPFWLTWQAYVIYFLLAVAVVYSIYLYQLNRLKRKQQRAMEKLQQQKEKELNQYKLQFFTNLAHEFGTPLTLIFASAASLLNSGLNHAESSKLLKTIYQNSRRMQRLVQELLEFRKIDSGREKLRPQNAEIVSTLNNITDVFSHFARENELELSFEPSMNELWVQTDTGKLEKILLNLLSNAMKYTPAGGTVILSAEYQPPLLSIRVKDTGIGISDESLPNIFNSFYQQIPEQQNKKNTFKGIGIGLAYTKSLVDLLGGNIKVQSQPGKGSQFTVELPVKPLNMVNFASGKQDNQQARLMEIITDELLPEIENSRDKTLARPKLWTTPKKYRILVAEDDSELSNLLLKLLAEQYDVILARDGKHALELIDNNRIDLVVSDIMMPNLDGLSLCKKLKSDMLTSHIPIILLTAKAEIENRIEGLEMGADSYIPKPFHPRHLFVRIEKLLKSREQISEYFKANFGTPTYDLQQDFSTRDKELLERCIAYIEKNHADENLDADHLASFLAMSKAQLYRKIKALTGLTPHGLIKNFRLKKARQMIAEGKYSISDIIIMTGFNNRTYFYRSYKEAFGETPGEINKVP